MKVAILSNTNIEPVNRYLFDLGNNQVFTSRGYGNELGILLNKQSELYAFEPEIVFVLIDQMELINHDLELTRSKGIIDEWFGLFERALNEDIIYYISDAFLYGIEAGVLFDDGILHRIEAYWNELLFEVVSKYHNVRLFSLGSLIRKIGVRETFSEKMWYMGKILYSVDFIRILAKEIYHRINLEVRQSKKVLLLDLDNTLWKGIAGESDSDPIILSDEGIGLAFKNFQRSLKIIKSQGVVLGIVSKNNETDAMDILTNHPHMILRPCDFGIIKINWKNKVENILQISDELNVGLDSMIFIDDNPVEQSFVREALPEVIVPVFPANPENLLVWLEKLYREYFEKPTIVEEDRNKTLQYQANALRKNLMESALDYEEYLDKLEMKLYRVDPVNNRNRLLQLLNKTNQFNLTTKRYNEQEIGRIVEDKDSEVFLYGVVDKFGDNGIVIAAIVEYGDSAIISEFTMSCRVMGRMIENTVIDEIERSAQTRGYDELMGIYIPTNKNRPVQGLYDSFGYKRIGEYGDCGTLFSIRLSDRNERITHVEIIVEGDKNAK